MRERHEMLPSREVEGGGLFVAPGILALAAFFRAKASAVAEICASVSTFGLCFAEICVMDAG